MDIKRIEKIDSNKMYKVYDLWPRIARKQYELNAEQVDFENISHIVVAGMGGAGAIGDIFARAQHCLGPKQTYGIQMPSPQGISGGRNMSQVASGQVLLRPKPRSHGRAFS